MRPLGALQEFDNGDKHRSIRVVAAIPDFSESLISGLIPGQQATLDFAIRPIQHDTPFAILELDRPTPNVEVRHEITLQVGIPHIRRNGQETILLIWPGIDAMNQAVRGVLNALAPFA
jgi:hypothetical protein